VPGAHFQPVAPSLLEHVNQAEQKKKKNKKKHLRGLGSQRVLIFQSRVPRVTVSVKETKKKQSRLRMLAAVLCNPMVYQADRQ